MAIKLDAKPCAERRRFKRQPHTAALRIGHRIEQQQRLLQRFLVGTQQRVKRGGWAAG